MKKICALEPHRLRPGDQCVGLKSQLLSEIRPQVFCVFDRAIFSDAASVSDGDYNPEVCQQNKESLTHVPATMDQQTCQMPIFDQGGRATSKEADCSVNVQSN